jgi:thioredoxin 1
MHLRSSWQWQALGVAALLLAGAIAAFLLPDGFLKAHLPTSLFNFGESDMSVTHDKGSLPHVNEATFRQMVLESQVPVLVDFYADWCGPCQQLAPVLKELSTEMPNVRIVKVDVDENGELANQYGIDSIPNLKLFKNGKVTDERVGLTGKQELRAMLSQ